MKLSAAIALVCALPLSAQYDGPAILTRGEAPAAMANPQISFRPFLEIAGAYDTGLAGVGVDAAGSGAAAFGIQLTGGISGVRSWKRTKVGLDYRGSLNHYAGRSYYDSSDQSFMLGVTHQLSKHSVLTLRESAGLFSRNFGFYALPQTVPFDPSTTFLPNTDYFDNRTIYLSTQADLTVQRSTRLSFNMGGDGFTARRRSSSLYGVIGGGARGDIQYRMSRRTTVGVGYTYSRFDYIGAFSGTDLHSFVGSYAIRLSRWWEFTGYAGVMRAETKFQESVAIDPVIAALLGFSTRPVIVHRIDYLPNVSGRLSRTFRRGVAYISGGHTVTPGNGLFLTSTMTNASLGYSYTGLRYWSFSAQFGYDRANSLGNIIGSYGDLGGSVSASRTLSHSLNVVASLYGRKYQSGTFAAYDRLIYSARIGLGFTPGDIPLRIW